MVEHVMYLALGFLSASLISLVVMPTICQRAVRRTLQRVRAEMPPSAIEYKIAKRRLLAEFAMSTRRLETRLDQLVELTATLRADAGRKNDMLNRLKLELGEKATQLQAARSEFARRTRRRWPDFATIGHMLSVNRSHVSRIPRAPEPSSQEIPLSRSPAGG
jgi:hypothetical protein